MPTVIPSIVAFRKQVLLQDPQVQDDSVSNQLLKLTQYFESDSTIIVANDCGRIVGYIGLVTHVEYHDHLSEFSHYGDGLMVTEGPFVHPEFWDQGIHDDLMVEAIQCCQDKWADRLVLDVLNRHEPIDAVYLGYLINQFEFEKVSIHSDIAYYEKRLSLS